MDFKPPWWTHMEGCMEKAKELGISYEELMNKPKQTIADIVGDYEDFFNPFSELYRQLPMVFPKLNFIRKNSYIYKLDNGFLLDFHYQAGEVMLKTRRVYATEGELELGIQELEIEFDNLLKEKANATKDES